jgi:hypothetical protein
LLPATNSATDALPVKKLPESAAPAIANPIAKLKATSAAMSNAAIAATFHMLQR